MKNNNTKPSIVTYGMWQIPYKAVNVLCPDGKRRTCKLANSPDTYYSIPASVGYKGKTVSGYVTSTNDPVYDLLFLPVTYGKNGALFDNPFSANSDYIVLKQGIQELHELWEEYLKSDEYSHYTMPDRVISFDTTVYNFLDYYSYKEIYSNVAMLRELHAMHYPPKSRTRDLIESLIVKHTPQG